MSATGVRTPLQGVRNIVRFNWPFYAVGAMIIVLLVVAAISVTGTYRLAAVALLAVGLIASVTSLAVSLYVYDLSGLYSLDWLDSIAPQRILSVNAGFDETSDLLVRKFPSAELRVCDFYDGHLHTEPSIRRARNAYPPYPGTVKIQTTQLPFDSGSFDVALVIMSAHEVRDDAERAKLFQELRRCTGMDGEIIVVEHVRDTANIFAYNLGAFHFRTRAAWLRTFQDADLRIELEHKINPWVTVFSLKPDGTAY